MCLKTGGELSETTLTGSSVIIFTVFCLGVVAVLLPGSGFKVGVGFADRMANDKMDR